MNFFSCLNSYGWIVDEALTVLSPYINIRFVTIRQLTRWIWRTASRLGACDGLEDYLSVL